MTRLQVLTLGVAGLVAATTLPLSGIGQRAVPGPRATALQEFPFRDQNVSTLLRTGIAAAELRRELTSDPVAPETLRRLLSGRPITLGGTSDAAELASTVSILTRALEGAPGAVAARLEAIAETLRFDGETDRETAASRLRPELARLQRDLGAWPAEDAARAAKALVSIESTLREFPSDQYRQRMRAVATRFPGTVTASLIDVEQVAPENTRTPEQIRLYDQYWRAHPGTAAGAYALFLKGFQLHVNVPITGVEPRGSDPTPRLLEVAAIVKELETGPYPDGVWRQKAPELITGFFVSSEPPPAYAPGNIDKALSVYADFARARFGADGWGLDSSITYVIESKMAALFDRRGDRVAGVDGFYAELERSSPHARLATLARGLFLLKRGRNDADARARGRALLIALAHDGQGPEARRAAAELAMASIESGDRAAALASLDDFLRRFPDASWAWLAHLRRGQLQYDEGAWVEAVRSFTTAANVGAHPPAVVIGRTLAARALEAAQQFQQALDSYRAARRAYDHTYSSYGYQWDVVLPAGRYPLSEFSRVSTDLLDTRVTQLSRALARPGGERRARAAWLLESGSLEDARATAAGDRELEHEIDFERALRLADAANPTRDDEAALRILSAVSGTPEDSAMFAGQVLQSAIEFRRGNQQGARDTLTSALTGWLRMQRARMPSRQEGVDADVAAIRQVLFRPLGDLPVYNEGWNAFTFPRMLPPFQIVRADVAVAVVGQPPVTRTVWHGFPELPNVLMLESADLARLSRVLNSVGGTARRVPQQIMETPNQPIGTARDLATFWDTLFASRPGHWGGWVLDTFPHVTRITFQDAGRTKALAAVTIGYSGGTVVLEKDGGRWIARRLIDRWIT